MPFHRPINNVPVDAVNAPITVTAPRAAGPGTLQVSDGALFGSPSPASPIWVSVFRGGAPVTVLEATGKTSNALTVTGAAPSSIDAPCNVGDTVMMCPTADSFLELQEALTPASDAITTATALRFACWGDSLTAGTGGTPYPTQLGSIIHRDCFNGGGGGDTSTQIRTRFVAATDKTNFAVVFWAGRNNFTDPSTVESDIAAMVAALGHTRYLVLAVLNGSGEPSGSAGYNTIVALNSSLASAYGAHYFDIRAYLVSQFNPSIPQDVTDHGNDVTPGSLRSDATHLNTAGYAIVAAQVAAHMAVLNPPSEYVVTTNMGALLAAPAGPIGSVQPTDGTFSSVTTGGLITAQTFIAVGPDSKYEVFARSTQTPAWQIGSNSGEFFLFDYSSSAISFQINNSTHEVYFAGAVATGTGATGARPTPAFVGAQWYDTTLHKPIWWDGSAWQSASIPAGANHDIQWNNAGAFAGGGPTWDGTTLNASAFSAAGSNSGYNLNRRDTGAAAFQIFSQGDDCQFFSYGAGGVIFYMIGATKQAVFVGPVATGNGATGARPTGAGVGAQWYDTTIHKPIWWDGSAWRDSLSSTSDPLNPPPNAQAGTAYTLALGDAGTTVTLSNAAAITLTVPPNSAVGFAIGAAVHLAQLGAGQVTITPGAGVTVNSYTAKVKLAGQYAGATLLKTGTDVWLLVGNLA